MTNFPEEYIHRCHEIIKEAAKKHKADYREKVEMLAMVKGLENGSKPYDKRVLAACHLFYCHKMQEVLRSSGYDDDVKLSSLYTQEKDLNWRDFLEYATNEPFMGETLVTLGDLRKYLSDETSPFYEESFGNDFDNG